MLQDPLSLKRRTLGSCRPMTVVRSAVVSQFSVRKASKRSYVRKGAVTLPQSPRTIS
jgi:hypothetical protein